VPVLAQAKGPFTDNPLLIEPCGVTTGIPLLIEPCGVTNGAPVLIEPSGVIIVPGDVGCMLDIVGGGLRIC
jgi:hypothetical protein